MFSFEATTEPKELISFRHKVTGTITVRRPLLIVKAGGLNIVDALSGQGHGVSPLL